MKTLKPIKSLYQFWKTWGLSFIHLIVALAILKQVKCFNTMPYMLEINGET